MSGSLKIAALLMAAGSIGMLAALPRSHPPTRLTFLSVGQGDCAVFQAQGHTILIDAGPNVRGFDAGQRIVLPDLRKMGIESIDLVLLSHPDMDHIGGLAALLKGVPVGRIGVSSYFAQDKAFLKHLEEFGATEDELMWLGPLQRARVGDFTVEVDCPEWHQGEPDNDGSEFVKISGAGASAVFSGDASAAAEGQMIPAHDWSTQVLHLGHHGSHTASSEAWLQATHPSWAIVSCGRNNTYGHPHKEVLERVQRLGIKLARTDREGDIIFDLGPHGWERITR